MHARLKLVVVMITTLFISIAKFPILVGLLTLLHTRSPEKENVTFDGLMDCSFWLENDCFTLPKLSLPTAMLIICLLLPDDRWVIVFENVKTIQGYYL